MEAEKDEITADVLYRRAETVRRGAYEKYDRNVPNTLYLGREEYIALRHTLPVADIADIMKGFWRGFHLFSVNEPSHFACIYNPEFDRR